MHFSRSFQTFAVAISTVFCISATPLIADAQPDAHGVGLIMRSQLAPQFCIDASLDQHAVGREVYIFKCHGRFNQRWAFTRAVTGNGSIVGFDGRCLDIRGRKVGDNTPVQLFDCHYGANQQFVVTPIGQLREVQSGKCITIGPAAADRKPVFIDECDGNPKQLWNFTHQL